MIKFIFNFIKFFVAIIIFIGILAYLSPEQDHTAEIESVKDAKHSLSGSKDGCVILNYHLINDNDLMHQTYRKIFGYDYSEQYNVSKQEFQKQMDFLHDNDIDVLSTPELEQHMKNNTVPDACVTITFDDIDVSVYDNAYPILQEYNYPFTVFIITNKLPSHSGVKQESLEHITMMKNSGLATVGVHTDSMHNPNPDTGQPMFLDPRTNKQFDMDTKTSKQKFYDAFGEYPKYFAYPHGFGTDETDEILVKNGITQIFTLGDGSVTNETNDLFMPRVLITESNFDIVADWLVTH